MNLRHWQYFLRVAEAGSLSRVASLYGVAQPALSRQIRGLEERLGVDLFVRTGRGVSLTPAGAKFKERAESILRQIDELPNQLQSVAGEPSGSLAVALPISMGSMVTSPLVTELRTRYPAVRLYILEGTTTQIRDSLLSGRCELGVMALPVSEPSLKCDPLVREPLYLFGPPDSGLSPDRPMTLEEVSRLPLILMAKPNSIRINVEHAMEGAGIRPDIVLEIENAPIPELILGGMGFSIHPSCIVANHGFADRLRYCPIEGLTVTWVMGAKRDQARSIAAEKSAALLRKIVAAQVSAGAWKATSLVG